MKNKIKVGDHVRLYKYPELSADGYGRVIKKADDGRFWVSTINMPYAGSVSGWFKRSEIEKE